jgi:hypothetical protein
MSKHVTFTPEGEPGQVLEDAFPDDDEAATPEETRRIFLERAKSGYTKVRHVFVQTPPTSASSSRPGTLAQLARNQRAAVLYLALLANWPWLSREHEPLPAEAWIRFLTADGGSALTWTAQSLSHAWGVLEKLNLIERPRKGRRIDVRPLKEDGSGDPYLPPTGSNRDLYLILPNEFWTSQLFASQSWPALSVLLILLKETGSTATAPLAIDRAQAWYGISRTTAEQGLAELRDAKILTSKMRQVKDPTVVGGRRRTSLHRLDGEFSLRRRDQLRAAAKTRVNPSANPAEPSARKEVEDDDSEAIKAADS